MNIVLERTFTLSSNLNISYVSYLYSLYISIYADFRSDTMVAGSYSLYAAFLLTLNALSVFAGVLRDSPGRMKRMSPPAPNGTVYYVSP